jgi:hypothetical protein
MSQGELIIESRDQHILNEILSFVKQNQTSLKLSLVSR